VLLTSDKIKYPFKCELNTNRLVSNHFHLIWNKDVTEQFRTYNLYSRGGSAENVID